MKAELTFDGAVKYLNNTYFQEYAIQTLDMYTNKWTYWSYGYLRQVAAPSEYDEEGSERKGKDAIAKDKAFDIWVKEAIKAENAVNRRFEGNTMKQSQYDALCMLAIDCGTISDDLASAVISNPTGKATETIFKGYMTDGTTECELWREFWWNVYVEMSGNDVEVSGPAKEDNPSFLRYGPRVLFNNGYINTFGSGDSSQQSSTSAQTTYYNSTPPPVPTIPATISQPTAFQTSEASQTVSGEGTDDCPATTAAIDKLMDSMCGGVTIPGLDLDSVLDNMVKKSPLIKSAIESLDKAKEMVKQKREKAKAKYDENDPEDKEELDKQLQEADAEEKQIDESKKKVVEDFKKQFKPMVNQKINTIKISFAALKDGIQDLSATVTAALSSIPLPSFIGTGSPNPAKPVAEFITIKHQLNAQLNTIMTKALDLCNAATDISFDLPAPVTGVLEGLAPLKKLIGTIPG